MDTPRAEAKATFPPATALVAMSRKRGPSRLLGIAMQMGFVPSRGCLPPKGTTDFADRPESAVMIPIIPS